MRLKLFFIFILILSTGGAWADPCQLSQTADRQGNKRIVKIDFPDGRRIIMVGQQHTDRDDMWQMLHLPDDQDLFTEVRKKTTSATSKNALPYFEEEKEILYDAVVNEGVKFIGVELSESQVPNWLQKIRELQDRMLEHSARTGESDVALISQARLAAYGPTLAMPLEQPALFLKARLYGIEDAKAISLQHKAITPLKLATQAAFDEFEKNKKLENKLIDMSMELQLEHYSHYDPKVPGINAAIINPLLSQWPEKYRKAIRKYLEAYLGLFPALYARDEQSTKNILAQNESGIIFIGGAHVRPIMSRLREACLKDIRQQDITSSVSATVTR